MCTCTCTSMYFTPMSIRHKNVAVCIGRGLAQRYYTLHAWSRGRCTRSLQLHVSTMSAPHFLLVCASSSLIIMQGCHEGTSFLCRFDHLHCTTLALSISRPFTLFTLALSIRSNGCMILFARFLSAMAMHGCCTHCCCGTACTLVLIQAHTVQLAVFAVSSGMQER